jgi:hypothetical protein
MEVKTNMKEKNLKRRIGELESFIRLYREPKRLRRLTVKGLKEFIVIDKAEVEEAFTRGIISEAKRKELIAKLNELIDLRKQFPEEPLTSGSKLEKWEWFTIGLSPDGCVIRKNKGSRNKRKASKGQTPSKINAFSQNIEDDDGSSDF